jgi:hypothetical protein
VKTEDRQVYRNSYLELTSARGGHTVQPLPTPESRREDRSNKLKEGINSQKNRLFMRGKPYLLLLASRAGVSFQPPPPLEMGITIKNHNESMSCYHHVVEVLVSKPGSDRA